MRLKVSLELIMVLRENLGDLGVINSLHRSEHRKDVPAGLHKLT